MLKKIKLTLWKLRQKKLKSDNRRKNDVFNYLTSNKTTPLSETYGADRGKPVDRYYIENFLEENKKYMTGDCLEILDNTYTQKYGHNISKSDILDIDKENKKATIYGDLRNLSNVADNSYDCIILTQVLQFIDNYQDAIKEIYRILKPSGTLLATVPSMSRSDVRSGVDHDFWRFTPAGTQYIFKIFNKEKTEIKSFGNVRSGIAFWIGMSVEELTKGELDYHDSNFSILVTVKAIK